MGLKSKILAFLSSEEPQAEVVKLESQKLDNGTEIIADEFKEGAQVFIKSEGEDGENVALPVGEYTLEGGQILIVEVEGEIASIGEAKEEEPKEEEEAPAEEMAQDGKEEEEKEDEMAQDGSEPMVVTVEHMEAMHAAMIALEERISALEPTEAKEDEEYMAEEPKVEELSTEEVAEEAVAPIVHSPEKDDKKKVTFSFPKSFGA